MTDWRRVRLGLALFVAVIVVGTVGYVTLGFTLLDALYQTVTTVTTVGFREVEPLTNTGKAFTIVIILVGVGTALYTLTVFVETLLEGQLRGVLGRQRMERRIRAMTGHVIICGWGRVGRVIAREMAATGKEHVVVDIDPVRIDSAPPPAVLGDATEDAVLQRAGVERASALVAALDGDAANLFVTLSARVLAQTSSSFRGSGSRRTKRSSAAPAQTESSTHRASVAHAPPRSSYSLTSPSSSTSSCTIATSSFVSRKSPSPDQSILVGNSIRNAHIRDHTGALVLALREPDGSFVTNPAPDQVLAGGQVLIAIGTRTELNALETLANRRRDA